LHTAAVLWKYIYIYIEVNSQISRNQQKLAENWVTKKVYGRTIFFMMVLLKNNQKVVGCKNIGAIH